ncbi:GNAT family N-acetyltransferase [Jeongeupia naejangsanensis]|uniref:GNAT family N-acetyltransferase n=1 Tax=Jeongeupia naejangsanensis TaxID=613195 RepID=A0ABS2BLS0_9NEIS|nr:GNAT family N-acetyltransferase [Jeongeupia naejangsanensis]MBM3116553.1 GNAT family N-acetyltransferase [Jeongeupia naejangsanensis]
MSLPTLLTPRLILRPFGDGDAGVLAALPLPGGTAGYLRELRRGELFGGATGMAICRRSDRQTVGCVGARFERDEAHVGLWLLPAACGNGFGVEAGRAFIDRLFTQHSPRVLLARTLRSDGAAARVLTRLGFDLDTSGDVQLGWRLRRLSWSVAQTSGGL